MGCRFRECTVQGDLELNRHLNRLVGHVLRLCCLRAMWGWIRVFRIVSGGGGQRRTMFVDVYPADAGRPYSSTRRVCQRRGSRRPLAPSVGHRHRRQRLGGRQSAVGCPAAPVQFGTGICTHVVIVHEMVRHVRERSIAIYVHIAYGG